MRIIRTLTATLRNILSFAAIMLLMISMLTSCNGLPVRVKAFFQSSTPTAAPTLIPTMPPAAPSPSATPEPSPTASPEPTLTPTLTSTPDRNDPSTWIWHEAGQPVNAPILLYHHVTPEYVDSDYYLTVEHFTQQMDWLLAEGYTSITASQLVQALTKGGDLPEKPVLITFDDGFVDVYQYAYPVLKERNMVATWYLVASYLDGQDCVTTEQAKELIAAGWEIGSHSMTHEDLQFTQDANFQMAQARALLMKALDTPINTIAYPFGSVNEYIFEKTVKYGYTAGMGLGKKSLHGMSSLYYLSRLVVTQDMTSADVAEMVAGTYW